MQKETENKTNTNKTIKVGDIIMSFLGDAFPDPLTNLLPDLATKIKLVAKN